MTCSEVLARAARASLLAFLFVLSGAAGAQAAINGFQGGDGDQASSCIEESDWACLTASEVTSAPDASGAGDDGFGGGSKETQPDEWQYNAGPVQSKADLRGAWTSVTAGPGGRTFLNLAFVRAGATGDTYVGIEINQASGDWVNSVGSTVPCRSDGDVLLSYAASNQPNITIHEWAGEGGPATCPDGRTGTWRSAATLGDAFEARMNATRIVNHLDVPRLGTSLVAKTFGEASVDLGTLADIVGNDADGMCSYFRHMSVKTRSSAEVGSSLQDVAQGSSLFARSCATPDEDGDLTAPAAPAIETQALACALPVILSGTSEAGATVTIYDGGVAVGFAVADSSGNWQAGVSALADGDHSITAEATDAAGNTSVRSAAVAVQVDTTAPAAPTLRAGSAGTGMVEASGSAEPGLEVTIHDGGVPVATVTSGDDGVFSTTLFAVPAGDHTYTATVADGCHVSDPSDAVLVTDPGPGDTVAPGAPAISAPAATCASPLTVSGTAEPAASVTVYAGTTALGAATADGDGAWSLAVSFSSDGLHDLWADAADAAGNRSLPSSTVQVDVDTTAPVAPALSAAWSGAGSVAISGGAEPGTEVVVTEGRAIVATLIAGSDGNFATTLMGVAATAHTYVATASDRCRTSAASEPATVAAPADTAAPAAPVLAGPESSCELPVMVSGTAEPAATVDVHAGESLLGSTVVTDTGAWELSLSALTDGAHTLSASATDAAGNVSGRSQTLTVAVDTTAPAVPSLQAARAGAATVELSGTAEPGTEVAILEGERIVATVTAGTDGAFGATLFGVSGDAHSYTATASDACRTSAHSAPASVASPPDMTAPAPPTISADPAPCALPLVVSGVTEPGASVTLFAGPLQTATALADGGGAWSISLTDLADGDHQLMATATDAAGNTSAPSTAAAVGLDTTAPDRPELSATWTAAGVVELSGQAEAGLVVTIREGDDEVATVTADADGAFSVTLDEVEAADHAYVATVADRCRTSAASEPAGVLDPSDRTAPEPPALTVAAAACTLPVQVAGTSEPGATVTVYEGAASLGSAVADGSGAWEILAGNLADGEHTLTADAQDAAGNRSARSAGAGVTVDLGAPAAPTLQAAREAGRITLTGEAEAGLLVTIREGEDVVATLTAAADGSFSATVAEPSPGSHRYTATAADACRRSPASAPASLDDPRDTTAPGPPAIDAVAASCALPVIVTGTAEPGATVTLLEDSAVLGSAVAGPEGAWAVSVSALPDGRHQLTARAEDAAGNASPSSAAAEVAIDTAAPTVPQLQAERDGETSVRLTGTAEPGAEVDVWEEEVIVATVTAAPDGTFETTITGVTRGGHGYVATASDACHTSAVSAAATVEALPEPDTQAPASPTVGADAVACALPVTISGRAEPGATVEVFDADDRIGESAVDATGDWQISLSSLEEGEHAFSAQARDAAGNSSARSEAVSAMVDVTAPAAPLLRAVRLDPQTAKLSGTAEPGSSLSVDDGDERVATLVVPGDGAFSVEVPSDGSVVHSYAAVASDACAASPASAPAGLSAADDPEDPETPVDPETPQDPSTPKQDAASPGTVVMTAPGPAAAAPRVAPQGESTPVAHECRNKAFRAYLPVKGVRRARFYVDGQLAAVVRKPDSLRQWYATIDPAKYAPGAHRLTARVTFRKRSRKPETLVLRFRRCDECRSRRSFKIRVGHLRDGERAVRAKVFVNGRPTKVVKGKRLRARIVLTGLPKGTYEVRIVARTNRGRVHTSLRTYRTCRPRSQSPKRANSKPKRQG